MKPDGRVRKEVVDFALMMEGILEQNDHKGGWHNMGHIDLFNRLQDEVDELSVAIRGTDKNAILKECIDIANFAMMIVDNTQGM